jgi:predicted nucleic acid-binding protein
LVAFLDAEDTHFSAATKAIRSALESGEPLLMPASAYADAMVRPVRVDRGDEIDDFIDLTRMSVVPLDRQTARLAADLRGRHRSLRLGDALVLATARAHDAALLTFDDRLGRLARR